MAISIAYWVPFLGARVIITHFIVSKWIWYAKNQKAKGITKRNSILNFLSLPLDIVKLRMKAFSTIFANNSFLILSHSFPLLVLFLFCLYQDGGDFGLAAYFNFAKALVFSAGTVFLLTSTRPLLFLGQAERYMEMLVVPVTILVWIYLSNAGADLPEIFSFIILYNFILIIVSFLYNKRFEFSQNMRETVPAPLKDLGNILSKREYAGNVFTVPTKFSYYLATLSNPALKYYFAWQASNAYDYFRLMEEDLENSEMPKDDLGKLKEKYHLKYLIFEKPKIVSYSSLKDISTKLLYENDEYLLFEILEEK